MTYDIQLVETEANMFGRGGGDQNGAIQILQTSVCIETKKA